MELTLDENAGKQLHKILQDLAHFTALYEQADDRFKVREEAMEQQMGHFQSQMQAQLQQVKEAVSDIDDVMSAAGAARWRVAAEKSMKQGEEHLKAIRESCDIYKKLADDSIGHLDHVSVTAEKRITTAMKQLSADNFAVVDEFQRRTSQTHQKLEKQSNTAVESIKNVLRWLRWDRVVITVAAAFLASVLTSIYVNSEWPWESHAAAKQERVLGETMLTVWPSLEPREKAEVNKILGTNLKDSA